MSRSLLSGVDATGEGNSVSIVKDLVRVAEKHTVTVKWTDISGSITAMTVALMGSINGQDFDELGDLELTAANLTAKFAMFHPIDRSVSYVKGNIKVLTKTGTHLIDVDYEAYNPK